MVKFFKWFGRGKQAPIPFAKAEHILGRDRVVSGMDVGHIWGVRGEALVPYSAETLRQKAAANKKGSQWFLVCVYNVGFARMPKAVRALSVIERDVVAVDLPAEPTPHYMLIDFQPRCKRWSWSEQERYLGRYPHLLRVPANVLCEALHAVYRVRGEEFLTEWTHLGELKPVCDSYPGSYPRRIGPTTEGVSLLSCLPVNLRTKVSSSCLIVMQRPEVNL